MSATDLIPIRSERATALADLHRRCMPAADGWAEPGLKRLIDADAARGFQAEQDGAVIGFILAFAAADEAEVLAICVAPEHRRQGLGRALLQKLERQLAAEQIVRLYLEARVSNLGARELYVRAGFGETGRRKGYYSVTDGQAAEDAVLMAKSIGIAEVGLSDVALQANPFPIALDR